MGQHTSRPALIVLGAGRPFRGQQPAALAPAGRHTAALGWCLQAFASLDPEVHVVGGYHFEEIVRQYPGLRYSVNPDWATTGSAASLFATPLDAGDPVYVLYGDIVVTPDAVRRLAAAPGSAVLAVDRQWRARAAARTDLELVRLGAGDGRLTAMAEAGEAVTPETADAQYIGLVKFAGAAVGQLRTIRNDAAPAWRTWSMPRLIREVVVRGVPAAALDAAGEWASFDTPQEVARFVLGSKAETLDRLAPLVRRSSILDRLIFTVTEWRAAPASVLDRIGAAFGNRTVIVRSSARQEDGWGASQAGRFATVGDVGATDHAAAAAAIDRVVASYGAEAAANQVLVQPMLAGVRACGVALTRALRGGGPYYVIAWDSESGSTATVTAGRPERVETFVAHREHSSASAAAWPGIIAPLRAALREIEALVGHDALDAEFAIDRDGQVVLLQLRPIATDFGNWRASDDRITAALESAAHRLAAAPKPPPFQAGSRGLWGVMPDWNPAEIIGERPRPLAFSLYRRLVTDEVWARQRAEAGYRDVRPWPLVSGLAGHPYVDVRASLNSFVPADLPDAFAAPLIDVYLARLLRDPDLHDKIEFDVAHTCLTFDHDDRVAALVGEGFPVAGTGALTTGLRAITRRAMDGWEGDLARIADLDPRRAAIERSGLPALPRAAALLADAVASGTLPFAHLARRAFIATSLLRSAVAVAVIDEAALAAFLRSMRTVASRLVNDSARVSDGSMPRAEFLADYGHLRPNTYEITAPTYAEWEERPGAGTPVGRETAPFAWPRGALDRLGTALERAGLDPAPDGFERFCRQAIEGREWAKFCFTRNVSLALEALAAFGDPLGLTRDELSYLEWGDLESVLAGGDPARLRERAEEGREWYAVAQAVELPPLVRGPDDVWRFGLAPGRPNFLGGRRAIGPLVLIENGARPPAALAGAVVLIAQADPGYDWLFAEGIAALVTAFGGANSHMAVRAAELGLPAAIGIGPLRYEQLRHARTVLVDAESQRLERLS